MERFQPFHLTEINGWYAARGLQTATLETIPIVGYIEHDVAAGFLVQTDTCVVYLEGFVTNPAAKRSQRSKALDDITAKLLTEAGSSPYTVVTVLTKHDTIRRRAKKLGFMEVGNYTLLTRKLP